MARAAKFQQPQLQVGRDDDVGLGGQVQRGGGVVLLEREFGPQQVEAERLVPGQAIALDAGQGGGGALDLPFLAPGFGRLQAIAVGMAAGLGCQRQVGLCGLIELALLRHGVGILGSR